MTMTNANSNDTATVANDLTVAQGADTTAPSDGIKVAILPDIHVPAHDLSDIQTLAAAVTEAPAAEVVAETSGTTEVTTAPVANAPRGKRHNRHGQGNKHQSNNKPARVPVVAKGFVVAGKDCIVVRDFQHHGVMLVAFQYEGAEVRAVVRADGLKLANPGQYKDHESRKQASVELLNDMWAEKIGLPVSLISDPDAKGDRLVDVAFVEHRQLEVARKARRAAKAANTAAVTAMVGQDAKNVLVVKKFMGEYTDRDTGKKRPSLQAVFVRVLGDSHDNDVQAYLHVNQINGGRRTAMSFIEGETVLPMVRVQSVEPNPRRPGDFKVTVSELETFPFTVGQVFRGAKFDGRREVHDFYVLTLDVKMGNKVTEFELFLNKDKVKIDREKLAFAPGKLRFVGFQGGRLIVDKVKGGAHESVAAPVSAAEPAAASE
jgi:hypothetical protein